MKSSSWTFHPLLLATYPILALLSHNIGQLRPSLGLRAMAASIAVALLLLMILRTFVGNWPTAGLITSLVMVLFYSYGPAYQLLEEVHVAGTSLGRHRYLAPVWTAILLAGSALALRTRRDPTRIINVVALIAIAIPLLRLLGFEFGTYIRSASAAPEDLALVAPEPPPDIYYIVLDGYGRQDVLQREFGLDISDFLVDLQTMGFQVADCSMSNYGQTELTFSTVLNLNYIDDLGEDFSEDSDDRSPMWPLIRDSLVRNLLEDLGYQIVAFETGFRWSELEDADLYLAPPRSRALGLSAFEATLLRSTAAWAVLDQASSLPEFLVRDFDRSAEQHYDRVLYTLDQLKRASEIPGPKFVFAHIVSPHPPFVFDPSGKFRDAADGITPSGEEYLNGYRDQVIYLNDRIAEAIEQIVNTSNVPPIVVLQGDHGPGHGSSTDRMSILNAIRVPISGEPIRSSLSPVNTFRLIFNRVFGSDTPLLPDESFFSTYDAPYDFSIVPPACETG